MPWNSAQALMMLIICHGAGKGNRWGAGTEVKPTFSKEKSHLSNVSGCSYDLCCIDLNVVKSLFPTNHNLI